MNMKKQDTIAVLIVCFVGIIALLTVGFVGWAEIQGRTLSLVLPTLLTTCIAGLIGALRIQTGGSGEISGSTIDTVNTGNPPAAPDISTFSTAEILAEFGKRVGPGASVMPVPAPEKETLP